ncbi:Modification methylase HindIII [Stieleria neptunia]|uniref:Methyltransferase n=1 Tax=Stieleria neptunia TaxID=2527979 RepID=A0A518HSF9_9BACT|nr:site-specific DNA-methyltransferase [Stieleria neptunia]QDV43800.1 Modification methylase HindIII [Stieleria neptunia]
MEPYYSEAGISIYHGDCRDVIPSLSRCQVKLVLTDPPFSERTHAGARTNRLNERSRPFIGFASMTEGEIAEVFSLCATNLQGWLISFVDWRHMSYLETCPPIGLRFVRFGIWDKPNGTPQISGDRPAMGWEAIAILHTENGRMRWNGGGRRAVWSCYREHRAVHRTQKPLSLVKQLAAMFSKPGDLILDPFMGSGTSLRAAKEVGCHAIGIEISERNCEIAANRLRQGVLF